MVEYVAFRCLVGLLGRLPQTWHGPLARFVARALGPLIPFRRKVLAQNLRIAFGELAPRELKRHIRDIREQSVLFVLETARMVRASPREIDRAIVNPEETKQRCEELRRGGKGHLIACAHMGNFEWLGAWYALTYGRLGLVSKPIHNTRINAFMRRRREAFGIRLFSTRARLPRELVRCLREGGVVAILSDQDAGRRGPFIPFFGRPASTALGMGSLAIRFNVPILFAFCVREGPCRFRIKLPETLVPDPDADPEAEERRLMDAYHRLLEEVIREAPGQYFWWHRRWKSRPKPTSARDGTGDRDAIEPAKNTPPR